MRWEELLDQLEGQWVELNRESRAEEIADLQEAEAATLTLASRFLGAHGQVLTLKLRQGDEVTGKVLQVGMDWILLDVIGRQTLIPFHGIALIYRLSPGGGELKGIARRISAQYIIREFARRNVLAHITYVGGSVQGHIVSAARDHLDISAQGGRQSVVWDAVILLSEARLGY